MKNVISAVKMIVITICDRATGVQHNQDESRRELNNKTFIKRVTVSKSKYPKKPSGDSKDEKSNSCDYEPCMQNS